MQFNMSSALTMFFAFLSTMLHRILPCVLKSQRAKASQNVGSVSGRVVSVLTFTKRSKNGAPYCDGTQCPDLTLARPAVAVNEDPAIFHFLSPWPAKNYVQTEIYMGVVVSLSAPQVRQNGIGNAYHFQRRISHTLTSRCHVKYLACFKLYMLLTICSNSLQQNASVLCLKCPSYLHCICKIVPETHSPPSHGVQLICTLSCQRRIVAVAKAKLVPAMGLPNRPIKHCLVGVLGDAAKNHPRLQAAHSNKPWGNCSLGLCTWLRRLKRLRAEVLALKIRLSKTTKPG